MSSFFRKPYVYTAVFATVLTLFFLYTILLVFVIPRSAAGTPDGSPDPFTGTVDKDWGNNPAYLNIDAATIYAMGGDASNIDTSLDSPYNTYTNIGLTPGPISNPGLSSLQAALYPESHNYYYYVLNPSTGMHQFSTTYEEHQGYVRQFNAAPEIEIE